MADIDPSRRISLLGRSFLVGLALCSSASPAPAQAPRVAMTTAIPEMHVGKPVFFQLVTPDLQATKAFYAALFGWQFHEIGMGATLTAIASIDDQQVAAFSERVVPNGARRQPAWLTFLSVSDVDAADRSAMQHGARALVLPHSVAGFGREAIYADPQGAVFGTLALAAGDPADELPRPGQWIWSVVLTTDPDADAAFYQSLFDYQVFNLPQDEGGPHFLLASDDAARATVNHLPPQAAANGGHPHWLNFVRVLDAEASAAAVTRLGGHVLVAPRLDRHGARIAVVSDPLGARFGLMEWAQTDNLEQAK